MKCLHWVPPAILTHAFNFLHLIGILFILLPQKTLIHSVCHIASNAYSMSIRPRFGRVYIGASAWSAHLSLKSISTFLQSLVWARLPIDLLYASYNPHRSDFVPAIGISAWICSQIRRIRGTQWQYRCWYGHNGRPHQIERTDWIPNVIRPESVRCASSSPCIWPSTWAAVGRNWWPMCTPHMANIWISYPASQCPSLSPWI